MQVPLRLLRVARTGTPLGLLLATAVSTATFIATPISLAAIADRFDVGPGTASVFSAAQLGFFVVASWGAGRFCVPSATIFRSALVLLAAANFASAAVDVFVAFVAIRALSGLALGTLTWLAWSQVFGDEQRQGDIAVIGPLAGVVVSPLLGVLLEVGDDRAVFAVLGVAALVPLLVAPSFAAAPEHARERTRAVPQARLLIAALGLVTLGGSAVFVFGGVILSDELGVAPFTLSLVYSANALASIPSARWRGPRPYSGAWMLVTAACAVALGRIDQAWMAWPVLTLWGFSFWAAIPGVFTLLSGRSAHPAERAGDAQAVMAAGRAAGPLVGGAAVSAWSFAGLGVVGGALVATAAVIALGVERAPQALPSRHG